MMQTDSSETRDSAGQAGSTGEPEVTPQSSTLVEESFLRVCVVALGIVIGGILALIIGLMTGWIPFNC